MSILSPRIRGAIVHVDHGEFGEFQPTFGSVVTAMIEHVEAIRLRPTFFAKGVIDGGNFRRCAWQIHGECKMTTVRKIKGVRKLSGIGSFAEITIPAEIPKGHASTTVRSIACGTLRTIGFSSDFSLATALGEKPFPSGRVFSNFLVVRLVLSGRYFSCFFPTDSIIYFKIFSWCIFSYCCNYFFFP